ncbi:MAG: hypothetical protein V4537_11890 [Pseudomonadota bacterium]
MSWFSPMKTEFLSVAGSGGLGIGVAKRLGASIDGLLFRRFNAPENGG